MILFLDNYDSFSYNIVQYFRQLKVDVIIINNDSVSIKDIIKLKPVAIILGPGPGKPEDAGITLECIEHFSSKLPILGVCLGFQAIAQVYGAELMHANQIMHGQTSQIYHNQAGIFTGIANPSQMMRYHSLVVDVATLPTPLEITACTLKNQYKDLTSDNSTNLSNFSNYSKNLISKPTSNTSEAFLDSVSFDNLIENNLDEIMAIKHHYYAVEGVQFHPESILSDAGLQLFYNFLANNNLL